MDEQNTAERDMQLAEAAVNNAYFDYRWNTFCYNLIHKTRFSLNEDDLKFINEITSLLIKYFTVEAPIGSAFFRARIIDGHKLSVQKYLEEREIGQRKITVWNPSKSLIRGYSKLSDIGIPPLDKAISNRASPKGIRYLYVADDIYTAVSEVRPSILEVVNVAEFTNAFPLKIIKIPRNKQELMDMAVHDIEMEMLFYLHTIASKMAFEFSRPIRRGDSDLEYLPTQYLVDAIKAKDASIRGIAYPSFQSHSGMNYVIFSQDDLTPLDKPERIIRVQNVTYDCWNLNDLEEKINPTSGNYDPALNEEMVCKMKKQIVNEADDTE